MEQVTNMVYALLVKDVQAGETRQKLDDILVGKIALPENPNLDGPQIQVTETGVPAVAPNFDPTDPEHMQRLRDQWGAAPAARQGQQAVREMLTELK